MNKPKWYTKKYLIDPQEANKEENEKQEKEEI